jgi:predicted nucleic acid-binding protein
VAELFVDTSAWYPAIVGDHADHPRVAAALEDAVRAGARLVTTNLVIMETHALLLHRVNRRAALAFVQTIYEPPTLVIPSTHEVEQRAIREWLVKFADQSFSFADAVSFAVMRARGIAQALTLDAHFGAAGFQAIPPASAPARRRR